MIEKIKSPLDLKVGNYKGTEFDIIPADTFAMVCRKINELIDTVNELTSYVGPLGVEFIEPKPAKNVQVDEIEQAEKWIGKLCWFSQLYGCHQHIAILKRISESGLYVTDDGELHYAYCEPVKPDDDIIYHGE